MRVFVLHSGSKFNLLRMLNMHAQLDHWENKKDGSSNMFALRPFRAAPEKETLGERARMLD